MGGCSVVGVVVVVFGVPLLGPLRVQGAVRLSDSGTAESENVNLLLNRLKIMFSTGVRRLFTLVINKDGNILTERMQFGSILNLIHMTDCIKNTTFAKCKGDFFVKRLFQVLV